MHDGQDLQGYELLALRQLAPVEEAEAASLQGPSASASSTAIPELTREQWDRAWTRHLTARFMIRELHDVFERLARDTPGDENIYRELWARNVYRDAQKQLNQIIGGLVELEAEYKERGA